ncbi:hypothetical protein [Pontivivens ytuae]|uniref:Integrase catalytic domain-containing protein n=1 Tax=Pontivivens ytuae TaxID=2789856 RepID=A0A7S9QCW1_9RHOB|nr:hypothetical protein [Pontivivens ytuae]QPH54245.1 hypothetical protein I0K15_00255 [Pontivivens ytuae]
MLDAMNMVIGQHKPSDVIHDRDRGAQYTSVTFSLRCAETGAKSSLGSVEGACDGAICENFFAILQCEFLDRRRFRTNAEVLMAIFEIV